ncbi:hypothetical protein HZS_3795 [Henneguya salminicola]|nr:hypothetical protein HZS_3795 [Henneguya salminicola]
MVKNVIILILSYQQLIRLNLGFLNKIIATHFKPGVINHTNIVIGRSNRAPETVKWHEKYFNSIIHSFFNSL